MKRCIMTGLMAVLMSLVLLLSGCGSSVDKDAILRQLNEAKNELQEDNKGNGSSLNETSKDDSSKGNKGETSEDMTKDGESEEETSEETAEESVDKPDNTNGSSSMQMAGDGEQLYRYVKEVLIPSQGLATLEPFRATCEDKENGYIENQGIGLLSADIHDLNSDGKKELVTFSVEFEDDANTQLGMLMNYAERSLVVKARLYGFKDGQIQFLDEVIMSQLTCWSFGQMYFGVRKSSGVYYIYGRSYNEDTTTYGPTPVSIYHVEGNAFVYDRIAGRIGWGQGSSPDDANAQLGTRNWDYQETALADTLGTSPSYRTAKEIPDTLETTFIDTVGPSLRGIVYVAYPDGAVSNCQNYDLSNLREIAETGYDAYFMSHPFPQEESDVHVVEKMDEDDLNATNTADAIVAEVQQKSGVTLTRLNNTEANGMRTISYEAPGKETYIIRIDLSSGKILGIFIQTKEYDITEDWIALKDATLNCSLLGLDKGALEGIYGACTNCSDQDAGNGARINIGQAVCCSFSLYFD